MSGHSKWATTKHKKAAIDAKRGKLFAKLIKNIEIAARMGGGDPDGNPSLYDAIYKAKKASMPADNIKRAVKRGSGEEAGGANYEDIVYEGYAPAGVGLIIECLTDNRNRAAAEVRSTLTKGNGSLATSGSVSFNFERKGQIIVPAEGVDFDDLFEKAAEAGAEADTATRSAAHQADGASAVRGRVEVIHSEAQRAAQAVSETAASGRVVDGLVSQLKASFAQFKV